MFKYGSSFVDERYSSMVEPLLYADNIFQPGVTYTDKYAETMTKESGGVGLVKVHKLKMTDTEVKASGKNDFTNEDVDDELIDIALNNSFMKSIKLYELVAASVGYAMQMEYYDVLVNKVRNTWTQAGLACLANEGTASEAAAGTFAKVSLLDDVLQERVKLRHINGDANVIICSPETFAQMLMESKTGYTPAFNDSQVTAPNIARMMYWQGFLWIETSMLEGASNSALKYVTYSGTTNEIQTVDASKIKYILYNPQAFSILDNLEVMRIVDTTDFVGSLAQIAINSGFKVTNSNLVVVRKLGE